MVNRPFLTPEMEMNLSQSLWVVFSDDTDIRMLKLLRRGFRHCFLIMQQDGRWILVDPRSNVTDVQLLPHPPHFNFPRYFTEQGKTVIKIPAINPPHKIIFPMACSCVETIKRLIGIHKWWVLTPYQLFKLLNKLQQKGAK